MGTGKSARFASVDQLPFVLIRFFSAHEGRSRETPFTGSCQSYEGDTTFF